MTIRGLGNISAAYAATKTSTIQRQTLPSTAASYADRVNISDAAKAMLADSLTTTKERDVQNRLDAIKAKPAVERTSEESEFVRKNDKLLAEILAKDEKNRTADEVDYAQKATGFVNTMAELTPGEKALYDELIAQGNWEAAKGLNLVGMSRIGMGGQQVTLPNGRVFDPTTTEVTADNIRNLFKQMFVDDTGRIGRQFEALASYLERRETADKATASA
ncbi:MAG: hypothetical protein H6R10_2605 [Rhodocyclaceae bacterium]|nr:hypothetical protein [Rhodocyclaceae bacterium]